MKFMHDTNICNYIITRKPPNVMKRFKQTKIAQIAVSAITLSELSYGVSKSSKPEQNQIALAQFIAPLEILPYGDDAAQYYGNLRTDLEKQGATIGSFDVLLAAHALPIDGTLVTNNVEEFIRIPNLKVENWVN